MNRSDRHRCVFFHVPRTGGSSIASLDWWDQWTGHFPKADEVRAPAAYFRFTFVRNPWDRLVSLYHYFAGMTADHRWYRANARIAADAHRFGCFKRFCRGFHAWPHRHNFHFWPQHAWITAAGGELLADFVGRFERLQDDFAEVCTRLGLPVHTLPRLNGTPHRAYRAYYDDETLQIAAALYERDVTAFGYSFETESNSLGQRGGAGV